MEIDKTARMSILFDFYGQILPQKQNRIFQLYYDDNLSLSEIGEEFKMSKQGVHDALKKAELTLEEFETKLKLVDNNRKNEEILKRTITTMRRMTDDKNVSLNIKKELNKIQSDLDQLNY